MLQHNPKKTKHNPKTAPNRVKKLLLREIPVFCRHNVTTPQPQALLPFFYPSQNPFVTLTKSTSSSITTAIVTL